jgi:tetratricopeptide (TPR) repeat protein
MRFKLIFFIVLTLPLISFSQKTGKDYFKDGYLKYNNSDYSGALADFAKALELKATNIGEIHFYTGLCYIETKMFDNAIKELSLQLRASNKTDSVKGLSYRGYAKSNLGDYQGALDDLDKAVSMSKTCTEAFKFRGDLNKIMGKIDEACIDWHKAGDLGDAEAVQNYKFYCDR